MFYFTQYYDNCESYLNNDKNYAKRVSNRVLNYHHVGMSWLLILFLVIPKLPFCFGIIHQNETSFHVVIIL